MAEQQGAVIQISFFTGHSGHFSRPVPFQLADAEFDTCPRRSSARSFFFGGIVNGRTARGRDRTSLFTESRWTSLSSSTIQLVDAEFDSCSYQAFSLAPRPSQHQHQHGSV